MRLNLGIGNHLLGFEKRLNLRINLGIEKTCVCRELTCNIFDATKRHLPEVHFLTHIENAKFFSIQNHTKPSGPGRAGGWGTCVFLHISVRRNRLQCRFGAEYRGENPVFFTGFFQGGTRYFPRFIGFFPREKSGEFEGENPVLSRLCLKNQRCLKIARLNLGIGKAFVCLKHQSQQCQQFGGLLTRC